MEEAGNAIVHAVEDGVEHGYTTEWMRKHRKYHYGRALRHVGCALGGEFSEAETRVHLEHALCRIAMALALDHLEVRAAARAAIPVVTWEGEGGACEAA